MSRKAPFNQVIAVECLTIVYIDKEIEQKLKEVEEKSQEISASSIFSTHSLLSLLLCSNERTSRNMQVKAFSKLMGWNECNDNPQKRNPYGRNSFTLAFLSSSFRNAHFPPPFNVASHSFSLIILYSQVASCLIARIWRNWSIMEAWFMSGFIISLSIFHVVDDLVSLSHYGFFSLRWILLQVYFVFNIL